jgi:integrase
MATRNGRKGNGRNKAGAFTVGKGWRKTIGRRLSAEGRLTPCLFWLGFYEGKATVAALQIEALWIQQAAPYWNAQAFKVAEGMRVGLTRKNAPEAAAAPKTPEMPQPHQKQQQPLTVLMGIERYRQSVLDSPHLTDATKHSVRCRTKSLERSPIASMPLREVGAEQLAATVAYWLARPKAPKTAAPISSTSAALIVKTARAVFDHLDGIGVWQAPRRFDRLFRLPRNGSAPKVVTLDLAELQRLYHYASSRMKLLILLGVNCGFCSMEIATLKRSEIDLEAKVIRRARQKTAVEQQWNLWDETAELIGEHLAPINEGDLALLTEGGKPLVYYSPHHRVDAIGHPWIDLLKKSKVKAPFKLLRKTGATMVRAIGGIEVSEQYLAHSEKSMARFYSRPDPLKLSAALAALRERLAPMFGGSSERAVPRQQRPLQLDGARAVAAAPVRQTAPLARQ